MTRTKWVTTILAIVTMFLSACSSGGDGGTIKATSVTGVAAAGAAIVGFAYLKDGANNELGPNPIAADGRFSFDLTKLPAGSSAPYFLQARGVAGGQSFVLHSIASAAGTANINPLTNLILAQATGGQDPAAVYDDTSKSAVTQANITAAITAMQTALAPLLTAANVSTTINPITAPYVANPATNTLDALFDAVTIAVVPPASSGASATMTVTDKSGSSILASTSVTTSPATIATNITASSNVTQTVTDAQGITTLLSSFAATINSKGTNLTASDMEPYYYGNDSTYGLQNGYNRTQTIQELVAKLTGKIITALGLVTKLSNFAIVNNVTANYNGFNKVYRVVADFNFQDGSYGSPGNMTVAQTTSGGPWLFIGNGSLIDADVTAYAHRASLANGSIAYETGLEIFLEDVGNQGVNSASLEGPGLPSGGVTFSKQATGNASNTRLALEDQFRGQQVYDTWSQLPMTDTQIGLMVTGIAGVGQYTLKYYSSTTAPSDRSTALVQTRHPIMLAAPIANSTFTISSSNTAAVVAGWFPTANINGLTHSLAAFETMALTTIPFTYTLPTAYTPATLAASINLWDNNSNNLYTSVALALNKSSSSVIVPTLTFAPTGGFLVTEVQDMAHRSFRSVWQLQ